MKTVLIDRRGARDASGARTGLTEVSVVIGTSGSRSSLADAVGSVLASDGVLVDLIVAGDRPAAASDLSDVLLDDPRLTYVESAVEGVSAARNVGIRHARNDVVLIIDDDVTVGPTWAADFAAAIIDLEDVAVAFCGVDAAPHDERRGFVPGHVVDRSRTIRSLVRKSQIGGIGAGMAVRRNAISEIGGFDEMLGPGAPFRASEDRDIAIRALMHGWAVHTTDATSVCHHGFRTWAEGRALTRRDWFGIGATYAKRARALDLRLVPALLHEVVYRGLLQPLGRVLRGQPPHGLKQVLYFSRGFAAGLRTPIDRATGLYRWVPAERSAPGR